MDSADGKDLFNEVADKITRWISTEDKDFIDYMYSSGAYTSGGFKAKPYWTQELEDIFTNVVALGNK